MRDSAVAVGSLDRDEGCEQLRTHALVAAASVALREQRCAGPPHPAAYLASRNKPSVDKQLFENSTGARRRGGRRRGGTQSQDRQVRCSAV